MDWDINNLDIIVNYINKELEHRTMIDIENNEFGVNERVINKRLIRKGYKKINNQYAKDMSGYNKSITTDIPIKKKAINEVQEVPAINNIDIKSLKELIGLIDPIKTVIQKYNQSITKENIIDVEPIEIKIDRKILNNKIKPVGFKIDVEVYEDWKRFTNEFKEIKNQDLLGMALIEYMKKYGSNK